MKLEAIGKFQALRGADCSAFDSFEQLHLNNYIFFPEALRRVLLLKAAANFTCQLLMPTCRELLHLPTSHANLSRVTSPANFSCQLVESYFTC